jgi:hypothetical protein
MSEELDAWPRLAHKRLSGAAPTPSQLTPGASILHGESGFARTRLTLPRQGNRDCRPPAFDGIPHLGLAPNAMFQSVSQARCPFIGHVDKRPVVTRKQYGFTSDLFCQ